MGEHAKRPRVAHVLISLEHGGLERCVVEWVQARERLAFGETRVICLDAGGALAGEITEGHLFVVDAERGRWPWDRRAVARLRAQLVAWQIDVVHSHNVAAQQYGGLASRGVCAHVHTEHGSNLYLRGISNWLRLKLLRSTTDAWVAVSTHTQRALAEGAGIACRCVENGISVVSIGLSRAEARTRLGVGDGLVIGVVGRLSREKGVDRLIGAMASLESVSLGVVGDGVERTVLEGLVSPQGGAVHFCGMRSDARACLPAFDLLVIPSRSEGLPMVLLEAMVEGIPVAVTDVGACAEVVSGGCGLVLPQDEEAWPACLAQALAQIGSDVWAAQVARAQARVHERYAAARTVEAYESIYEEVLLCSRS